MGDEAILLSELLVLKEKIGNTQFHVISFGPERTARLTQHIQEVKKIIRMGSKWQIIKIDLLGLLRSFRTVDIVVIGGGGIFQDIYNYYPIPFFTLMAVFARINRKKTIIYSVGIGPIKSAIGKILCRVAAESAQIISVRDPESKALLQKIGVRKEIHVTADPAFLLEPKHTPRVEKLLDGYKLKHSDAAIGVCVHDLLHWHSHGRKVLAEILDSLISAKGVTILLIPFGAYNDGWTRQKKSESVDLSASKKLVSLMRSSPAIVTSDLFPDELLAVIERMDLIISMRLHGLIMAATAGTASIALTNAKESKVQNLMKSIGRQGYVLNMNDLCREDLLTKIERSLSEKDHIRRESITSIENLRNRVDDCNSRIMRELGHGNS